jgi:hypothetical protein
MDEEKYINYYGEEVIKKRISYGKVIEVLKKGNPPERNILWHSFE